MTLKPNIYKIDAPIRELAHSPLIVHVDDSSDAGCVLEDISAFDGRKVLEVIADIKLNQIIQIDPFEARESNDSDYGPNDPFEEECEFHYKNPVSHEFCYALDAGTCGSSKDV